MSKHIGHLTLTTGRQIQLWELQQLSTYEGLLEGLPTIERNRRKVDSLMREHRDKPYLRGPYLLRPDEKPIPYKSPDGEPYSGGTPSELPAITCIGRFKSQSPARDENCEESGLVIIWFQEAFALPIDPMVVAQIQAIDWNSHAADLEW